MSNDTQAREDRLQDRRAFLAEAVGEWERLSDAVEPAVSQGDDPDPDLQERWHDAAHEVAERAQALLAWPARATSIGDEPSTRAAQPATGEHNGMPWKVDGGQDSGREIYPTSDVYQFGCWPVLVIETGGYNDVEIIDPYSKRKLWIGNIWSARKLDGTLPAGGDEDRSLSDVLRRIADVLEATAFMETENEPPVSRT